MGLEDRVRKLRARITPPAPIEPPPGMGLYLKLVDHRRRELDYEDRGHNERLRAGEDVTEPPGPLALTLDERREQLRNAEWFLTDYIPEQRKLNQGPDTTAALDDMEVRTREKITKLREEIRLTKIVEGENA